MIVMLLILIILKFYKYRKYKQISFNDEFSKFTSNKKYYKIYNCRDWVRALLLLDEWSQAQYNKFVENEFKN